MKEYGRVPSLKDFFSKMELQGSFYLHFQKIPIKFRVKKISGHSVPIHRDLDWLLSHILPTHDYTEVITQDLCFDTSRFLALA